MKKLIFTLVFLFLLTNAYSQNWSAVGGGTGWENAMCVYNGELYVGGVYGLLKWNGANWTTPGTGVNGEVDALAVYNNEIYAGGRFTLAGGVPVSYIAKWNGNAWFDVEGGMDSYVVSLAVYNNELVAGGYFLNANVPANYIAKWNGSTWSPLGAGTGGGQGQVMALTVYNNELVAAGFFSTAGGMSAGRIAKWNGSTWSALGSGIDNVVYALTVYNGNLIAGGLFSTAGGSVAHDIASWNGSAWSTFGSGCSGGFYPYIMSLTTYGSDLYVAGLYTIAGGLTANGIAKWNGSTWSTLGSGFANSANVCGAFTSCIYNNELYCGGIFYSAGGVSAGNIAKYGTLTGINTISTELPNKFKLSQNYPNPFNPVTNIKFDIAKAGNVILKVYDIQGREVSTLINEKLSPGSYQTNWNAANFPSGTYYYRLISDNYLETKKLVLVK